MSAWTGKTSDACLQLFLDCQARWDMPWEPGATILEIGCAEADWLSLAAQNVPDAELMGIDHRPATRPGLTLRGDVRDLKAPEGVFDWVVLISALEHIGLGRYGDPVFSQGDRETLERAHRWLQPGGHLYFDVPWTTESAYLACDGPRRIAPWDERWRGLALDRHIDFLVYDDARLEWLRRIGGNAITRPWGWREQRAAWQTGPLLVDEAPETVPPRGWVYRACWWTKV